MGAETGLRWAGAHGPKRSMASRNIMESEFPAGLRVLVVDDDRICLLILDRLLQQCLYRVTTCERAADALKILRDNKDGFDVIISDVHMPDMDGYKLLDLVGLEMDLPVLMMSSNSETSAVMKGIKHGACDYLLKPLRIEELKNIWQHVIRRKLRELDKDEQLARPDDGADALIHDGSEGALKGTKKRKENVEEEDDFEPDNDDPATSKKPRVVWTGELHEKFVTAVNNLGLDKAVPKRILELMDVKGLTRENVASHLQKYRLYLKRISGVAYQGSGGLGSGLFGAADERFLALGSGLMGDFRSQLHSHGLVSSLHPGFLDRVSPNGVDPVFLGQFASIQGINSGLTRKPPYGVPLLSSANVNLNAAASTDLELVHMSRQAGGGQVSSLVNDDKLSNFALPSGAHIECLTGQENHILSNHKNKSLVMQILQQQQRSTPRVSTSGVLPETQRCNVQYVGSDPALPQTDSSLNALNSSCRSNLEMATLGSFSYETSTGLGPFRKKLVGVRPHNYIPGMGFMNYTSSSASLASQSSSVTSQSILHGFERSCKNELAGLQSVLSDQVDSGTMFRFTAGLTNNWRGCNQGPNAGRQSGIPFVSSNFNQGSTTLSQASSLVSYIEEPQTCCWTPNFQSDFVEDIDVKPLATTGTIPPIEETIGESDQVFKEASLDSLAVSKVGTIPEPFPSSDDLLACLMKQQQQDMVGLSEGDAADGYRLGNMYVK